MLQKFLKEYYNDFPKACGAIPILEHVALTGETVIDGPELVTTDNLREIATYQDSRWLYPSQLGLVQSL